MGKNIYFAVNDRVTKIAYTNAEMQSYLENGYRIICRYENGADIIVGENGAWIGEKPDVEAEQKAVKQFNEKVYQMAADLDYLSMMTGIEL